MTRPMLVLLSTSILLWLGAWGKLAYEASTSPSPAHQVRHVDAENNPIELFRVHCYGSALTLAGVVYQSCEGPERVGESRSLVRFDLQEGIGYDTGLTGQLTGALLDPDGELVLVLVVIDEGTHIIRMGDTPELLGILPVLSAVGWVDGHLEAVERYNLNVWRLGSGGAWAAHPTESIQAVTDDQISRHLVVDLNEGVWEFLFATDESRLVGAGEGAWEVPLTRVTGSAGAVPTSLTVQRHPDWPYDVSDVIWVPGSNLFNPNRHTFGSEDQAGLLYADGDFEPVARLDQPHGFVLDFDYSVSAAGLEPLLVRDYSAWVRGHWYTQVGDWSGVAIERDDGLSGPVAVGRFWLGGGFKMLPDGAGGFWLTSKGGEVYIHVDETLTRTDGLGFLGRLWRLFENDRAKYNSDTYYEAASLKRASVVWLLLGFPLTGLLLLLYGMVTTDEKRRAVRLQVVLSLHVVASLAAAVLFWPLSRFF